VKPRPVEVTLFGKTSDLKGMQWPHDPDNRMRSWSVEEPCDLTVRVPSGKVLRLKTRPILIASRIMPTYVIGSVYAPPEGIRGSLRDKAAEVERLLDQWKIKPDAKMRADLVEWKQANDGGRGVGGRMRVFTDIDERTQVFFRVSSGGPRLGGWDLVVEIEAKAEEWERVRKEESTTGTGGSSPPRGEVRETDRLQEDAQGRSRGPHKGDT
jgi:hypothetical protein